jgi:hypothetical protein
VLATDTPAHALPSLGFALDLGDGMVAKTPGYSGPIDCKDPVSGARTCDNFAFPNGDMAVNPKGMTDVDAYAPFPNAIVMNCEYLSGTECFCPCFTRRQHNSRAVCPPTERRSVPSDA